MAGLKTFFFGSKKTPTIAPPAKRMSDPMDPALLEARRARTAQMQRRGGRESTILSEELSGSTGALGG